MPGFLFHKPASLALPRLEARVGPALAQRDGGRALMEGREAELGRADGALIEQMFAKLSCIVQNVEGLVLGCIEADTAEKCIADC